MQNAPLGRRALQEEEESEGRSEDRPLQEAAAPEKRSWFGANWLGLGNVRTAEKMPHIVHVDVDAFFASGEQVLNPKLRGKPLLVARGVVGWTRYERNSRG